MKNGNGRELREALAKVDEGRIPVMSRERSGLRKERAKLVRKLFKSFGIGPKLMAVKTPNYSMASTVDIEFSKLADGEHDREKWPHKHGECCSLDRYEVVINGYRTEVLAANKDNAIGDVLANSDGLLGEYDGTVRKIGGNHAEETRCPGCRDEAAIRLKIEEILARAFPNNDDRSDYGTDYYDYCWGVS